MEINTSNLNQPAPLKNNPAADLRISDTDDQLGRQSRTAESRENERQSTTADTVNLSAESIRLANPAPVQATPTNNPISNAERAQQAVQQLVSDIQSSPRQAQFSSSNAARVNVGALLR